MIHVTIPYRGMPNCLDRMVDAISRISPSTLSEFSFTVVEQSQDGKRFNLGKLINTGYALTKKSPEDSGWLYMFHPVDMIPIEGFERYLVRIESFNLNPQTGVLGFSTKTSSGYYKAAIFKPHHYEVFNGLTNNFWGWGAEDDELFARLKILGMPMTMDEVEFDCWYEESTGMTRDVPQSPDFLLGLNHHPQNISITKLLTKERMLIEGLNSLQFKVLEQNDITNKVKRVLVQL